MENHQYELDRIEETGLEIQAKYGTITHLGQERLNLLQAKKAEFWERYMEREGGFNIDLSLVDIPATRAELEAKTIQSLQPKPIDIQKTSNSNTSEEQNTSQNLNVIALHSNNKQINPKLINNLFILKEKLGIFGEAFFELSAGAIYQYCIDNTMDFPFYKLFPGMEQGLKGENPIDHLSNQYPGFRVGRMIGDVAALYTALGEIDIGSGIDGAGLVATPETGGASLALTVPGTTLIIHGTSTSIRSLADLFHQGGIVFHIEGDHQDHKSGAYHGTKPKYTNPGHHDQNRRPGKSMLPSDAEEVYKKAIPTKDGKTWWGINSKGEYYRYQGNNQEVHWNGSFKANDSQIPNYIKKRFEDYSIDKTR